MDDVHDHPPRISSSNCVNGVLERANFSRVSSEEKLDIIRRFQNNPRFDELDLYYLGLLDEAEESSEKKKIPEGSSEAEPSMKNLHEIDHLPFLKKIPKKKRSKREEKKAAVDDRSAPEAMAAVVLLSFKDAVLNQNHPLLLEEELTNNKKKKLRIIMTGKTIDDDCCRPIDDTSGPKKEKKRPRTDDQTQAAVVLLSFKDAVLNQNHPLLLEEGLTNNKKKKLRIIMCGKTNDCCRPIGDTSGPKRKKNKKRPCADDQPQEAEEDRAKKIRLTAPPPPEVPPKLKTRIETLGGSQVMLVIEKELFPTDVTAGNGRFSLPLKKINPDFLIPEEREFLSRETTTGLPKPQIETQLIQPCGEECTINLREWHMKPIYNLVTTWNDVVKTNSLRKGMIVQLWSFRVASQLRLALVEAGKDIQ